jgi:hypothetical protein
MLSIGCFMVFYAALKRQRIAATAETDVGRIIRGPVAAFARTRGVSVSCARALANAATTVCHAHPDIVNNPG